MLNVRFSLISGIFSQSEIICDGSNPKVWATNTNNEGKQQVRINRMF